MTTGNTSINTRVYTVFPWTNCSGSNSFSAQIGWLTTRAWGGGNYSSSSKPPKVLLGTRIDGTKRYSFYAPGRGPKRSRLEDHGYNLVALKENNAVMSWTLPKGPCAPGVSVTYQSGFKESFGGMTTTQRWTANDDLALLGKLRQAITGSTFNAGVSAAEGSQSLSLILKTAGKLNSAYGNVRKGRVSAAWRDLTGFAPTRSRRRRFREGVTDAKTVASNWLELQYGWKPLLNDVFEACASLAHFLNTPLLKSYRVSRTVEGSAVSGYPNCLFGTANVYTRVGIIARVREASVPALLGLTDPASLVWEKLPFSFVADWFIPIGSWLSSRGLASSMTATYVISKKIYARVGGPYMVGGGLTTYPAFKSDYSCETCTFTRTVTTVLDVPRPSFKSLGSWLTWKHAADGVALLVANQGSKGLVNSD